jgi:hypothetical protein
MSRDAGLGNADVDVDLLEDPKIRRLIRLNSDEATVTRAIVAYLATVLASWAEGERVPLADAVPLWISSPDDLQAKLVEVGLVEADGRIVEHAWTGWFGPAAQRRDDRRFEGMVGGLMRSLGLGRTEAEKEARRRLTSPDPRSTSGPPTSDLTRSVPSVPTVPSVPSGHTEPLPTEHPKSNATDSPPLRVNGRSRQRQGAPSLIEEEDLPEYLRARQ